MIRAQFKASVKSSQELNGKTHLTQKMTELISWWFHWSLSQTVWAGVTRSGLESNNTRNSLKNSQPTLGENKSLLRVLRYTCATERVKTVCGFIHILRYMFEMCLHVLSEYELFLCAIFSHISKLFISPDTKRPQQHHRATERGDESVSVLNSNKRIKKSFVFRTCKTMLNFRAI